MILDHFGTVNHFGIANHFGFASWHGIANSFGVVEHFGYRNSSSFAYCLVSRTFYIFYIFLVLQIYAHKQI